MESEISTILSSITKNVIALMNGLNFKPLEFSVFTDIPSATIYKYKKGNVNITLYNLIKIARSFKLNPQVLISTDGTLYNAIDKIKHDPVHSESIDKKRLEIKDKIKEENKTKKDNLEKAKEKDANESVNIAQEETENQNENNVTELSE